MERVWDWILNEARTLSPLRFAGVLFPALISIAYATQQWALMAITSLALVVLLLGVKPLRNASYRSQVHHGGEADLDAAIETALSLSNAQHRCAVVMLELDTQSDLIDAWGEDGVATIMATITDRLCSSLRNHDVIVPLPGNRIALSLPNIRVPELGAVISLVERLQSTARSAISIDHTNAYVTLSAGFCLEVRAPQPTPSSLRDCAILAMLDAKTCEQGSLRGYSPNTPQISDKDRSHTDEVLRALQDGEIVAWYQPQLSTDTGEITGFEALARWEHPTRGTLSPAEFLPALEAGNAMEQLSETMLQNALRAIRAWDAAGHKVPSVAVNFATQDLRNPSLIERIKWDVDRFEMRPERLTIEILETVISEDDDIITRNIRALGDHGYRIDLDDFGTGHASLANIRRFAVDRIKIDRSFVTFVDEDPEQQKMVNAIVSMAEQMGVETLAEGVETIGEKSILSQLGCTHMQGFAIARPMPFDQTIEWIAAHQKTLISTSSIPRRIGRNGRT